MNMVTDYFWCDQQVIYMRILLPAWIYTLIYIILLFSGTRGINLIGYIKYFHGS